MIRKNEVLISIIVLQLLHTIEAQDQTNPSLPVGRLVHPSIPTIIKPGTNCIRCINNRRSRCIYMNPQYTFHEEFQTTSVEKTRPNLFHPSTFYTIPVPEASTRAKCFPMQMSTEHL
ncbi:hypothetical protein GGR51DRAFT_154192 [Nemania sp. FL0031]|nr:hypothetical protein GGR51DRAFT_154192 [Nemania sp. FL0031]